MFDDYEDPDFTPEEYAAMQAFADACEPDLEDLSQFPDNGLGGTWDDETDPEFDF